MDRGDLEELHFITAISNISSILARGILSHNAADSIGHVDISMAAIQNDRARITVPGGRPLHDYANLYFHARNPMMSKRRAMHDELAVLRIHHDVIDIDGVVVTDQNAKSEYARFAAAPDGLAIVDRELTYSRDWRDSDRIRYWRMKSRKLAEVLVPNSVPSSYVFGAYVSVPDSIGLVRSNGIDTQVELDADLFFLEESS